MCRKIRALRAQTVKRKGAGSGTVTEQEAAGQGDATDTQNCSTTEALCEQFIIISATFRHYHKSQTSKKSIILIKYIKIIIFYLKIIIFAAKNLKHQEL